MPAQPRPKGKGKQIAYSVLGVPQNMQVKRSKPKTKVEQRLLFEETARVR